MKVRYTLTAVAELGEMLDYIAERSPQGARNVLARIEKMVSVLSQHPYSGTLTDDAGMRFTVASPYPYLIFYQVDTIEGEIVIVGLRHSSRDPSSRPR